MLSPQARKILSWVTLAVVLLVLVSSLFVLVRFLTQRSRSRVELQIVPAETSLCIGQQVTLAVSPPLDDVEWAATGGGEVSADGLYVAGEIPGDFEVQAVGPHGERGRAVVHVVACTPTPPPTPTLPPPPTPTPTPQATPIPAVDPLGDVAAFTSGAPVARWPVAVDIANASVAPDLRVTLQPTQAVPAALVGWAAPGEALLWIMLYEPITSPLETETEWLFALDLDGNTATGRPVGSGRINPDLGTEAAVGAFFDPAAGAYSTYLLIWDPAQGDWKEGPQMVRSTVSADGSLIALAVPVEVLQQEVAGITGVTLVPGAVRGRAAAIAYVTPEAVVDFYPDRP